MKFKKIRKSAAAVLVAASAAATIVTPAITMGSQSVMAETTSVTFSLEKGRTISLKAFDQITKMFSKTITITTDKPDVLSIKDGVVSALKEGTAKIIAKTSDGKETVIATVKVVAANAGENISINIEKGKSAVLSAIEKLKDKIPNAIDIKTDNPEIIKIKDGVVTAIKEGTANIIAKTEDGVEKVIAQIKVVADKIDDNVVVKLEKGREIAIAAIEKLNEILPDAINIRTDMPDIISIKDGIITALEEGSANIIAKTKDGAEKVIARIEVAANKINDDIVIDLEKGKEIAASAIDKLDGLIPDNVVIKTDTPDIVSIKDGVIKAIKEGTAVIKAYTPDGKEIAQFIINVINKLYKNGWIKKDGKFYYYKNNVAYTGWHWMTSAEGEKTDHWSYFGNDGVLRTGWQKLGVGTANPDGNNPAHFSYFGDNGWLRTGWNKMGVGTANPDGNNPAHYSYFGDNGWLRTDWQRLGVGTSNPDGNNPAHYSYFGPNGWLRTDWQELGVGTANPDGNNPKHKSYFGSNGWLRTGKQNINGKTYIFDGRGWLTK